VFYGNQHELEYDIVAQPGADLRRIRLHFDGAKRLTLTPEGDLRVALEHGEAVQRKPFVYQDVDGIRRPVEAKYVLKGKRKVAFAIADHDPKRPLVIDPTLGFSTLLTGSDSDWFTSARSRAAGIAIDGSGNAYVAGTTPFVDFAGVSKTLPPSSTFRQNAFVTKIDASGSLVYSAYVGGTINDWGLAVAADAAGRAYVTGSTSSNNFPTVNAYMDEKVTDAGSSIAFVSVLSPDGSALEYSTYLGGSVSYIRPDWGLDDLGRGIAVSSAGRIYVTGYTSSVDFPRRGPGIQPVSGGKYDAFVASFDPFQEGDLSLVYSTYLGGAEWDQGSAIVVDRQGNAWVTGDTASTDFPLVNGIPSPAGDGSAFVTGLNADAGRIYSTRLGGVTGGDEPNAIAVDSRGAIYVTGTTSSWDFFTKPPGIDPDFVPPSTNRNDAFVAKINPTLAGGDALVYSQYLGGNGWDSGAGIGVDRSGSIYIAGGTTSTDFLPAGTGPVFLARFDASGALLDGSRIGYSSESLAGMAVSSVGDIYLAGNTDDASFGTNTYGTPPGPVNPPAPRYVFVAKTCDCDRPAIANPYPEPTTVSGNGWTMDVQVSNADGLVLWNVTLGSRYMAERISIPYYSLKTVKDGLTFFEAGPTLGSALELRADGQAAAQGASRLVDFRITAPTGGYTPLVVEATYSIGKISPLAKSCLRITQRYEFYPPIDEDEQPELSCEPSQTLFDGLGEFLWVGLTCARFNPVVAYDFCPQEGETASESDINIPMRFNFKVDASSGAAHLLTRDKETRSIVPVDVIGGNPLSNEFLAQPVVGGAGVGGTPDNFHQMGRLAPGTTITLPGWCGPGCPECVHMHWRWAGLLGFPPGLPPGRPLIPLGSDQDIEFGVVRVVPGEDKPMSTGFESFVTGEPIANSNSTLWYSPTGHQATDTFLTHGLFFSPEKTASRCRLIVVYPTDATPGLTTFTDVSSGSVGSLPAGFGVFEDPAVDIQIEGTTGTGDLTVAFGVPAVDDPALFSRLRVFHNEGGVLVDRTILAPDTPASSAEARTLYARVPSLGRFVIAVQTSGAGNDDIFADDLETGDISRWSSAAGAGNGAVTVTAAAGLNSTGAGLQVSVRNREHYVQDDSPNDEPRYRVRFYFDPNSIDLHNQDLPIFRALTEPYRELFTIDFKQVGTQYKLRANTTQDDDALVSTEYIDISDSSHSVEVEWKRASSATTHDGTLQLWIDGTSVATLVGLANSMDGVDFVQMGDLDFAIRRLVSGSAIYLDEFVSRRERYIGP
jgi:hypothetical protein